MHLTHAPRCRPRCGLAEHARGSLARSGCLLSHPPSQRRRRTSSLQTRAGLDPAGVVDLFFGSPLKTAGTLGISFASFRAILYYNLQYILAAHISNNVPRDATVVEFGCGTGLSFNYYPSSTQLIYGVDKKADPGLLGTVGAQAGKTVSAQQVATYAERLSFATGAADAVLSIDALGLEDDVAGAVAEASRVLKPGGPLLFFEQGRAPGPLTEELRKCGEYSSVRYDDKWASYPLAPHSIGIAIRNDAPPRADDASRAAGQGTGQAGAGRGSNKAFAKPKEAAPTAKGFGAAAKKPSA